ncbi:hypothetical protein ACWV27_12020 [Massilia varians]
MKDATLTQICNELQQIAESIRHVIPDERPLSIVHNNWSFPGVNRSELIGRVNNLVKDIQQRGTEYSDIYVNKLISFPERLSFLRAQTVPQLWANAAVAVPSFILTLEALENALKDCLEPTDRVLKVRAKELEKLAKIYGDIDARLKNLGSRTVDIVAVASKIENANDIIDRISADLELLQQAKNSAINAAAKSESESTLAAEARTKCDDIIKDLENVSREADEVLQKCEKAYTAATSQGLAAAFTERSEKLEFSMWIWVGGLVIALSLGGIFGSVNLIRLLEAMRTGSTSSASLALNLGLSVLSVAAPIWFAWLATKQVGQRFRLAEDYAFKASVSRAYEGYRKEATRIDATLEARLLSSALTRLEEQPLRFVEEASHGSPWQDLLSSEAVSQAVKTIPGFASSMIESAKDAVELKKKALGKFTDVKQTETAAGQPAKEPD